MIFWMFTWWFLCNNISFLWKFCYQTNPKNMLNHILRFKCQVRSSLGDKKTVEFSVRNGDLTKNDSHVYLPLCLVWRIQRNRNKVSLTHFSNNKKMYFSWKGGATVVRDDFLSPFFSVMTMNAKNENFSHFVSLSLGLEGPKER